MTRNEARKRAATAAGQARKAGKFRRLPSWPPGKPRPTFASDAEEAAFLRSYSFARYWEAQAATGEGPARRAPKVHVYPSRFTDERWSRLEAAAARRGESVAAVLRDLVRQLPVPERRKSARRSPVRRRTG